MYALCGYLCNVCDPKALPQKKIKGNNNGGNCFAKIQ